MYKHVSLVCMSNSNLHHHATVSISCASECAQHALLICMFMSICIVLEDALSQICTVTPLQHCPARLCNMVSNKCVARSFANRVMTHSNVVGLLSPCIQSCSRHAQAEQKLSDMMVISNCMDCNEGIQVQKCSTLCNKY